MQTQIHHFYDRDRHGDDIHSVVHTAVMQRGLHKCYKAYLVEGPGADLDVRGYGDTELSAIASLNRKLLEAE
jgi:hypothetical protein